MRKTLSSLLALSALLIALPVYAQTVSNVTVNPSTIQGGQTAVVTVTLSGPASSNGTVVSLDMLPATSGGTVAIPQTFLPGNTANSGATITIPSGSTSGTFDLTPLPVDTASEVFIGAATSNGPFMYAPMTLMNGPTWQYRIAVYRPSTSQWILRDDDGSGFPVQWGQGGDLPVPNHYQTNPSFPNFQAANIAVFRPGTSQWFIRGVNGGADQNFQFGAIGDWPAPADYLGLNFAQLGVFEPSLSQLVILNQNTSAQTALPIPGSGPGMVPEAFNETGAAPNHGQAVIYDPAHDNWIVLDPSSRGSTTVAGFGQAGDMPMPGDYLGLGHPQLAYYRPSTGTWIIQQANNTPTSIQFGLSNLDMPVPGDYLGLGHYQLAVFRPTTAEWFIRTPLGDTLRVPFGQPGDMPVPRDYGRHFGGS